jgi:hypothetical protein
VAPTFLKSYRTIGNKKLKIRLKRIRELLKDHRFLSSGIFMILQSFSGYENITEDTRNMLSDVEKIGLILFFHDLTFDIRRANSYLDEMGKLLRDSYKIIQNEK